MNEKISVVIPVYKVENYIHKCMESILNQTYDNLEIVLIDDGSPDNCPEICDKYAQEYSNVIVYHKENGGLGDARNYGVTHAKGDYIAFVDSDDWVEENYILHLYEMLQNNGADIAITSMQKDKEHTYNSKNNGKDDNSAQRVQTGIETMAEVYIHDSIGWTSCAKLFKKSLLTQNPFPDGYFEDCAVMYKILFGASRVVINDKVHDYHYVRHDGSVLKSMLNEKHFRIFDVCDEFQQFIDSNCPEYAYLSVFLKRAAVTQMLNCQKMSNDMYRQIFTKYRHVFRESLPSILKMPEISKRSKMMLILHCTSPFVYKSVNVINSLRK